MWNNDNIYYILWNPKSGATVSEERDKVLYCIRHNENAYVFQFFMNFPYKKNYLEIALYILVFRCCSLKLEYYDNQ